MSLVVFQTDLFNKFSILTVQGSVYTQNPKYGIYAIDGTFDERAVYKQVWPYSTNFVYFKNEKYVIRSGQTSSLAGKLGKI